MAGDIREIDMAKATNLDGKKVRLVGDDGKGYWMEKDTFISVVGGLLPVATNSQKGLMNKNMATIRIPSFAPGNYVKISLEYSTCSLCTLSFRRASASISTLISLSGVLANISKLYFQIHDFEIYSENKDNGYLYIVNVGSNTGELYITPLNNSEEEYGISAELISSNSFIPDGKTKLSPLFSK